MTDELKNKLFAVIEVDMVFDYVNGLGCIKTADSEEECQNFINDIREKVTNSWHARSEYIDNYVSSIEFHDINNHEDWLKFLSRFPGIDKIMVNKANFHTKLREYLNNGYKLDGFTPPSIMYNPNLHIVEIK